MVAHSRTSSDQIRRSREIVQHLQCSQIYRTYAEAFQTSTGLSLGLRAIGTHADQLESAIPIQVGASVVAYLQTGQITERLPVISQPRFHAMLRLLAIFAEQLSTLINQLMVAQVASELPAVAKARLFIAEHQTEEISLGDVARAVNMSAFYFCKTFRKVTGLTFVDYLARLRVESVKQHLLAPHKRISEAAFEAGFQSLSQFNRVFRRVAGEAPTVYREKLHPLAASDSRTHANSSHPHA